MTIVYLMRHAESLANTRNILAGQIDFPLSMDGKADAIELARQFSEKERVDAIWSSPLLRAQQTASPFVTACDAPIFFDNRLKEQNLGRFSGLTYPEAEADPEYCTDRKARWDWVPAGDGESYRMIADRVQAFTEDLLGISSSRQFRQVLIVTHAVTLRLFRAVLEKTIPLYPEKIAANGEIWKAKLESAEKTVKVDSFKLELPLRTHKA